MSATLDSAGGERAYLVYVPESYDGKYDITFLSLRVSSRPTPLFRWNLWARDWNYDNRSPEVTFADYVATDYQFPLCGNATTAPGPACASRTASSLTTTTRLRISVSDQVGRARTS